MRPVIRWTIALLIGTAIANSAPIVDVSSFGAIGDGVTDDTDALQKAVDLAVQSGRSVFLPKGRFLLRPQGKIICGQWGSIDYALKIEDQQDFELHFVGPGSVTFSVDDLSPCNALVVHACANFKVAGLSAARSDGVAAKKKLYTHYALILSKCKNYQITDVRASNIGGAILAIHCSHGVIRDVKSSSDLFGTRGMPIGSLGSSFTEIANSTVEGGSGDGDIFHFGKGTMNRILGCIAINNPKKAPSGHRYAQGIGMDSGQSHGVIAECYAENYYYGIDVKTETADIRVLRNTLVANKVGIAVRRGEGNRSTFNTLVQGNSIYPSTGNGAPRLPDGTAAESAAWGILVQSAFHCTIEHNYIGIRPDDRHRKQNWIGIVLEGPASRLPSQSGENVLRIRKNTILQEKQYAGRPVSSNESAILAMNINGTVIVENNYFVTPPEDAVPVIKARSVHTLLVEDNSFPGIPGNSLVQATEILHLKESGNIPRRNPRLLHDASSE